MNAITKMRLERGLTKKELAELVGVSGSAISQWESGKKGITKKNLESLASALNTSVDYLVGKTENPVHIDMDRVDAALWKELQDVTPDERAKVLAFLAGLKANRVT